MKGLIIRSPWTEEILSGRKIWEIRGSRTSARGRIALILAGSGTVIGFCDLIDVVGPLTIENLQSQELKHRIPVALIQNCLPYKKTFAWVVANPARLCEPIRYIHPRGAIIWVNLDRSDEISTLSKVT